MGDHSAPDSGALSKLGRVARWTWTHRRKVAAVALVAIPILARYVPGFPAAEAVSLLRTFLGA